uniref:Uncharacterized protein n=1 Tax=Zea mays TaxID=4577 RepID=B6U3G9_MAIZE|nr:hypothetical protein [Zea mays]
MRAIRFLELWATGGAAITRRSSIAVADPRVTADGDSSASLVTVKSRGSKESSWYLESQAPGEEQVV